MWLMLQQDNPEDYVISTGETHSIREFLNIAFKYIGIDDWKPYVKQDLKFMRPAEVDLLIGDSSKAEEKFNWKPKTPFKVWVGLMVENDVKLLSK